MSTTQPANGPTAGNVVVLHGTVANEPTVRELRTGERIVQFDLRTIVADRGDRTASISVPVSWTDPSDAGVAPVVPDAELVVVGSVRRRFFNVGGQTQSRTEVVVDRLVPTRRRKSARALVAAIAADLTTGFG